MQVTQMMLTFVDYCRPKKKCHERLELNEVENKVLNGYGTH